MFKLERELIEIMQAIEAAGHQIYIVGGYVRDLYLKRTTRDLDMATSMSIKDLKELLSDYEIKDYSEHYGSLKLEVKTLEVEITQMRKEFNYVDGRHPERLEFTQDVNEDALRRDFTMNALYLNKEGQTLDPVHGLEAIKNQSIQAIGDPFKRFSEDALRIVRLYRFHLELDFKMEEETLKAAQTLHTSIQKLKAIQYKSESIKILSSQNLKKLVCEHKDFVKNLWPKAVFSPQVFHLKNSWEYKLLFMFEQNDLNELLSSWEFTREKKAYLLAFKRILNDYQKLSLKELFLKHGSFMWFEMMTLFLNSEEDFIYRKKFLDILNQNKVQAISDLQITGQDLIDLDIPDFLRNQFLLNLLFDHLWKNLANEKTELIKQIVRYKHDIH